MNQLVCEKVLRNSLNKIQNYKWGKYFVCYWSVLAPTNSHSILSWARKPLLPYSWCCSCCSWGSTFEKTFLAILNRKINLHRFLLVYNFIFIKSHEISKFDWNCQSWLLQVIKKIETKWVHELNTFVILVCFKILHLRGEQRAWVCKNLIEAIRMLCLILYCQSPTQPQHELGVIQ